MTGDAGEPNSIYALWAGNAHPANWDFYTITPNARIGSVLVIDGRSNPRRRRLNSQLIDHWSKIK